MKVQVYSRILVKPCTPTPPHLRSYKISAIDELNPPIHVIRIVYYPPQDPALDQEKQLITLKQSLAKVLPLFYPLAGRYKKQDRLIDCNDEGAEYIEARVDCELHQLMSQPDIRLEQLNHLLPLDIRAADKPSDPILAVQINTFCCGSLAIGVCVSHRIFDSCSLGIFLTAWALAARGIDLVNRPDFDRSSLFPVENVPSFDFGVSRTEPSCSVVARRFVFNKNAISDLRDVVAPSWNLSEHQPSRVAVVSAFLSQALLRADRAKHGRSRASLFAHEINIRERTVPPIPKHACGSWVLVSYVEFTPSETQNMQSDYPKMVSKMREAMLKGVKDCAGIFEDKKLARWRLIDINYEIENKARTDDYKIAWITDWSKFGDYEIDFGFGKPVWVSLADVPVQDLSILMNTKDNDGIEAWVYLNECDMPYFERDEDLILLTGIKPQSQFQVV